MRASLKFLLFSFAVALLAVAPARTAGAGQQAAPPETKVDASNGGVTMSSGVNSLTIGARAQFRWTVDKREGVDADKLGSGVGISDGPLSQFDIPRLRIGLSGGAFRPWMKYSFQFDISRTAGESASKIKDAILEIRPTGKTYRIQAGQFKVPFSLQQITSSGRQQFVDRSITDSKFAPARDMGVVFSGTTTSRKVGYEAGVFNGAGESNRQTRESPLWVARVIVDPMGPYGLVEGSSDAGDKPVLHLGVAARGGAQIRGRTTAGVVQDADNQTAVDVEFAYKAPRFYSTAEAYWMTDERHNPVALPDLKSMGFHAQAGFMVVPRRAEVAIRFAQIEGDTSVDDAAVSEVRGAFGYYWRAHNLKVTADIGQVSYDAGFSSLSARARAGLPAPGTRLVTGQTLADTEFRVQFQLAF